MNQTDIIPNNVWYHLHVEFKTNKIVELTETESRRPGAVGWEKWEVVARNAQTFSYKMVQIIKRTAGLQTSNSSQCGSGTANIGVAGERRMECEQPRHTYHSNYPESWGNKQCLRSTCHKDRAPPQKRGVSQNTELTPGHWEGCESLTQWGYECKVFQHHIVVQVPWTSSRSLHSSHERYRAMSSKVILSCQHGDRWNNEHSENPQSITTQSTPLSSSSQASHLKGDTRTWCYWCLLSPQVPWTTVFSPQQ